MLNVIYMSDGEGKCLSDGEELHHIRVMFEDGEICVNKRGADRAWEQRRERGRRGNREEGEEIERN